MLSGVAVVVFVVAPLALHVDARAEQHLRVEGLIRTGGVVEVLGGEMHHVAPGSPRDESLHPRQPVVFVVVVAITSVLVFMYILISYFSINN